MKKYLILLAVVFLSGCSVIQPVVDRFFIAPFDPNEYSLVNSLRTNAIETRTKCDNNSILSTNIKEMYHTASLLKNYSQYLPRNDQTIKPVNLTFIMVSELKTRFDKENKINKTYCELKIQSIIDASELIQQTIGKRPR
jgi:hypothetical protein